MKLSDIFEQMMSDGFLKIKVFAYIQLKTVEFVKGYFECNACKYMHKESSKILLW